MPLPLTLACLACSLLWGSYALVLMDVWVLIPNGAGLVLTLIQTTLWFYYYSPKSVKEIEGSESMLEEKVLVSEEKKVPVLETTIVEGDKDLNNVI